MIATYYRGWIPLYGSHARYPSCPASNLSSCCQLFTSILCPWSCFVWNVLGKGAMEMSSYDYECIQVTCSCLIKCSFFNIAIYQTFISTALVNIDYYGRNVINLCNLLSWPGEKPWKYSSFMYYAVLHANMSACFNKYCSYCWLWTF